MVNFRKVGERNVACEVIIMKINPTMDIVALALQNGEISLHRLLNWQRVWQIPKIKRSQSDIRKREFKILDIEWSPDGKVLAVAYNILPDISNYSRVATVNHFCSVPGHSNEQLSSSYFFYEIDTNRILFYNCVNYDIECFCWHERGQKMNEDSKIPQSINIDHYSFPLDTLNVPFVDLFVDDCDGDSIGTLSSKLFGCELAEKASKERAYVGKTNISNFSEELSKYDTMNISRSKTFNLLIIGGDNGIIDVYSFGIHYLFSIDFTEMLQHKSSLLTDFRIRKLWISNEWNSINVMLKSADSSFLYSFECKFLFSNWKEIFIFSKIKNSIDICMAYFKDSMDLLTSMLDDLISEVDSKLSNYIEQNEELDSDTINDVFRPRSIKTKLKPEEFIEMLVFGEVTLSLEKFLTDINSRGLKKLSQSIENCFMEMNMLNTNQIQRVLFQLFSYLYTLRGITLCDERFGDLCLQMNDLNHLIRSTKSALTKTVELQSSIGDSTKKIRAFIRWLQKCFDMVSGTESTCRDVQDQFLNGNNSNDIANTALSNQDLQLIMEFLRENSLTNGFKFDSVSKLLRSNRNCSLYTCCCSINMNSSEPNNEKYCKLREQFLKENPYLLENKQKISLNDDLLKCFLPQIECETMKMFDDSFDSKEINNWCRDLFDKGDDISVQLKKLYSQVSLPQHLNLIRSTSVIYFNRINYRISELHRNLFQQSSVQKTDLFKNILQSILLSITGLIQWNDEAYLNRFDCRFVCGDQVKQNNLKTEFLYVMFASGSIMTILRYRYPQNCQSENIDVELARILFSTKCFNNCKCEQSVSFDINDCKFYNEEQLILLLVEKHFDFEIIDESSLMHGNLPDDPIKVYILEDGEQVEDVDTIDLSNVVNSEESANNRKHHQYLALLNFQKLFNHSKSVKFSVQNFFQTGHIATLHEILFDSSLKPTNIDLSYKVHDARLKKTGEELMDVELEKSDDFSIKLRYLTDCFMANVETSGNRRLTCTITTDKINICTYDIDVSEDEDEEEDNGNEEEMTAENDDQDTHEEDIEVEQVNIDNEDL